MARIRKGEAFDSYQDFKSELTNYEKAEYVNFVVSKSVLDENNPQLKYKKLRLDCRSAGTHIKTSTERETKTCKIGCGSYISVQQKDKNGVRVLEIVNVIANHNHSRSKKLFDHMPKQRAQVAEENKNDLAAYFATKSNVAAVQTKLSAEGKIITRRDLYNAKVNWKKERRHHENELVQLIEVMANIENATTKIVVNPNNEVEFIYFQDSRMKKCFDAFPDLILFDGTYNLNDRKMPLVVVMIVDGSGVSQIVAFIIVQSENIGTFLRLFEIFKEENPKHNEIRVIMSDKSFANRATFRDAFPEAEHHFCVFHVLQIFDREITTKKREITTEQKTNILQILRAMVYAESESKYIQLYEKLKEMNCQKVNEYFEQHWHNIRDQWVGFYVNQYKNYENRTNNRLESFNQKIKTVVSKYSGLANFFEDLWTCTLSYNVERDHQVVDDVLRKSLTKPRIGYVSSYSDILTNYAYRKVCQQAIKSENIRFSSICDIEAECLENSLIIKTSDKHCTCAFFTSNDLPCAHIFAFLDVNNKEAFQPALCNKRWLIENNKFVCELPYMFSETAGTHAVQSTSQAGGNTSAQLIQMTPIQKYQAADKVLKQIGESIAKKPQDEFEEWMKSITRFRDFLENDQLPGKYIMNS